MYISLMLPAYFSCNVDKLISYNNCKSRNAEKPVIGYE